MTATTGHPFGEPIHVYTRADALADGTLVEVPAGFLRDAGLRYPMALTRATWEDCVAWSDEDNRRKGTVQDEDGRLWDVVWMASRAILRAGRDAGEAALPVYRVPRPGRARAARKVTLKVVCGPGDDGSPVLTVMQPDED